MCSPLFFGYATLLFMKLLITGGAGFIGGNFVHYWVENHPQDDIVVLDKLTYAGNLATLEPIKHLITFIHGDIADPEVVDQAMAGCDAVVHFAAETHVDRSIHDPFVFSRTNVIGTHVLLEAARKHNIQRFHHISTDEVFGHIPLDASWKFNEDTKYKPSSAYSASKAASDHLVNAYFTTYKLPITITNCSNNFGPYLHPEKFIPRSIIRLLDGKNIPIYTPGNQVRDWLYVRDHCRAIETVLLRGQIGETYCVGGMTDEVSNLEVAKMITAGMGLPESRIEMVTDRAGHDAKYAVDWTKINRKLGWSPETNFASGLVKTIEWYKNNEAWWRPVVEETEKFYQERGEKVLDSSSQSTTIPVAPQNQNRILDNQLNRAELSRETTKTMPENDFIIETNLPGVLIVERPTFADDRGFFRETFRKNHLEQHFGQPIEFMQANHSRSSKGTLRGIHIAPWHKLVTVTSGEVQAVIVDTRPDSPTFGKYVSVHLTDKHPRSIFVPAGCGNSFLVLSESADYTYMASEYWAPGKELMLNYSDPNLAIPWAVAEPVLSEKDQVSPMLSELFPEKSSTTASLQKAFDKVLILGSKGNLGRELIKALADKDVTAWDSDDLDITNPTQVEQKITELKPDVVFNCAAYTNVDGAESDYETAQLVNGIAVGYLAATCAKISATLVHYSTGMVFPGTDSGGYSEDSIPNPVNAYGQSKLLGEQLLQSSGSDYYLIRTAWLYASPDNEHSKKSFNEIMLDLAAKNPALKGVDDEVGPPTWAKDLAESSRQLIESGQPSGIYHLTNSGSGSRFDWTSTILQIKNIDIPVEPVSGSTFPRPAIRPRYELLKNTKLPTLRNWQDALKEYLNSK